jgi:replicative DNA helicase
MNYSIESEQTVLGCILIQNELIYETILAPEDFYHKPHQIIFEKMLELREKDIAIEMAALYMALGEQKDLIGGFAYLADLAKSIPSTSNFEYYERTVKEKAQLRSGLEAMRELCTSGAEDPSEMAAEMMAIAEAMNGERKDGFKHIRETLIDHFDEMNEKLYNPKSKGISTAGADVDRITGKYQKQTLVIIAARPSMGKTAYLLNNARRDAAEGVAVAIFSLEQPETQLMNRMIAADCHIDADRIKNATLTDEEWIKYTLGLSQLSELPIYIDDRPGQSIQEIRSAVRKLKKQVSQQGMDLIVYIDYLQLIQSGKKFKDRNLEVGYISNTLKQIARENDCTMVALSQLSRDVEKRQDKRPMMSDLRESGNIEQDADLIKFLYRDDYYNQETDKKNIVEIIVAKNREGSIGTAEMVFIKNYCKFVDLERGHY